MGSLSSLLPIATRNTRWSLETTSFHMHSWGASCEALCKEPISCSSELHVKIPEGTRGQLLFLTPATTSSLCSWQWSPETVQFSSWRNSSSLLIKPRGRTCDLVLAHQCPWLQPSLTPDQPLDFSVIQISKFPPNLGWFKLRFLLSVNWVILANRRTQGSRLQGQPGLHELRPLEKWGVQWYGKSLWYGFQDEQGQREVNQPQESLRCSLWKLVQICKDLIYQDPKNLPLHSVS